MHRTIQDHRTEIDAAPGWPERLIELTRDWRRAASHRERTRLLAEIWFVLNHAISRSIRARSWHTTNREDIEDLTSEKAVALLERLNRGDWDPAESTPGRLRGFVGAVARNAIADHGKARRRLVFTGDGEVDERPAVAARAGDPPADASVDGRRFIDALRTCVQRLSPKARTIWFFRVLLDLPSKEIATHPDVGLGPASVDVTLTRARKVVRRCMTAKHLALTELPTGTFTSLWESCRSGVTARLAERTGASGGFTGRPGPDARRNGTEP